MTLTFYLEGVLLSIVGAIGLVGNVCALIVFSRNRRGQRNFHALMLSLAIFDMIYIIVNILLFSLPQFSDSYMRSGAYFHILPRALPFAQIGLTGSIYFTMAITVERYLTVCHPFYKLSHEWPAKYYVIPIFCFSFIYNIPKFFELKTDYLNSTLTTNNTNSSDSSTDNYYDDYYNESDSMEPYEYGIGATELRLNENYYNIYCMWLNFILMGVGPYALLIILNTLMLLKMKEMQREREIEHGVQVGRNNSRRRLLSSAQPSNGITTGVNPGVNPGLSPNTRIFQGNQTSGQRNKEVGLAKISLIIVFVFIVCHSLKWIPNIYELMQLGSGKVVWPRWVVTITNISHLATTFNASVNFYIYFCKHYHTLMKRRQRSDDNSRMVTIATTTRIGEFQVFGPASGANRSPIIKLERRYLEEDIDEESGILLASSNSQSTKLHPDLIVTNGSMTTQL